MDTEQTDQQDYESATYDHGAEIPERKDRLGATDFAPILGLGDYGSPYETWLLKTGRLTDDRDTKAMSLGRAIEPILLDYAEGDLNPANFQRDVQVAKFCHPVPVVATLDALAIVGLDATPVPVEAKTTGLAGPAFGTWGQSDSDEVPANYACQVQIQMYCSDAAMAYLYALLPGKGIRRYHIPRNQKFIDHALEYAQMWWENHVTEDTPPETENDNPEVVLRALRAMRRNDDMVPLDGRLRHKWQVMQSLKEQTASIQKYAKAIEKEILLALGDCDTGWFDDGTLITFKEIKRRGYVVEPTTYRVLKERKPKDGEMPGVPEGEAK